MTETQPIEIAELPLSIRLTPEQKRWLSEYAWRRRSNMTREIHRALSEMFEREGVDWANPPDTEAAS